MRADDEQQTHVHTCVRARMGETLVRERKGAAEGALNVPQRGAETSGPAPHLRVTACNIRFANIQKSRIKGPVDAPK